MFPITKLDSLASYVFALWFASGFILDGTAISDYSAVGCFACYHDCVGTLSNVLALLVASSVICIVYLRKVLHEQWKVMIIACLAVNLIVYVITIARTYTSQHTVDLTAHVLYALLSGLIAAKICCTSYRTIVCMCFLVAIEAFWALARHTSELDTFYSGHLSRLSGTYDGPFALYKILIVCLPVALSQAIASSDRVKSALWCSLFVIIGVAFVLTWYRMAIVSAAISLLFVVRKLKVNKGVVLGVCVVASILIATTEYFRVSDNAGIASSERSALSRPILWEMGLQQFIAQPIIGVGVGKVTLWVTEGHGLTAQRMPFPSPQNQVIFVLAESGIVGGTFLLLFSLAVCCGLQRNSSPTAVGIMGSWLALFFCGLTDTIYGINTLAYEPINCAIGMMIGATLMISKDSDGVSTPSTTGVVPKRL